MTKFQIAKINNTHGINGTLKITSLSDFNRFYKGACVYYLDKNNTPIYLTVKNVKTTNKFLLVDFKEITSITHGQALKNTFLYTDEMPRENDELHYADLMGLTVALTSGEIIGVVTNIIFNPVHDILEVINSNNKKTLIPFHKEFIQEINKQKQIVVKPIEGLCDAH